MSHRVYKQTIQLATRKKILPPKFCSCIEIFPPDESENENRHPRSGAKVRNHIMFNFRPFWDRKENESVGKKLSEFLLKC